MQLPEISGMANPAALALVLLVIPIVILYLLKPKPKLVKFPTVMFIRRIEETRRFSAFLHKFIRDPLLLLQSLLIFVMVAAIANPYALLEKTKGSDESIALVIDGSASMQSTDVSPSRFDMSVQKAKDILSGVGDESRISIILAENIPVVVLSEGSVSKALSLLDRISCGDTTSNIGDALILAKDLISQSELKKVVYVISDFSRSDGDVLTSKKILKLNDVDVRLIKYSENGNNLGIIDLESKRLPMNKNVVYLTYTVKNLGESEKEVTGKVYIDDVMVSMETRTVNPMSDELFYLNYSVTPDSHFVRIEVVDGGFLSVDDRAYAVIPKLNSYKTMLLTSGSNDKFVSYAIDAQANNNLRTVEPPVIPAFTDFSTVVIGDIRQNAILPGTFRDLKNFVSSGGSLIVLASQDLTSITDEKFSDMLPVVVKDLAIQERNVLASSHEMLNDVSLENVVVRRYYRAEAKENATVIAETEGNPLIAYWSYGKGKVAYIGINPSKDWSNMHYSSSFPIFWSQLVEYVNQKPTSVKALNYRTGEYLVLEKELEVSKPSGLKTTARSVFLDRVGFYAIATENGNEFIAVNLISEDESDIRTILYEEEFVPSAESLEKTGREELFRYIIVIVLLFVLFETYIYRRRGLL